MARRALGSVSWDSSGVPVMVGLGCDAETVAAGEVLARAEIASLRARLAAVSAPGGAGWLAQFVLGRALRAACAEFDLVFGVGVDNA
jgi:hypothetical protein